MQYISTHWVCDPAGTERTYLLPSEGPQQLQACAVHLAQGCCPAGVDGMPATQKEHLFRLHGAALMAVLGGDVDDDDWVVTVHL